MTRVTILIESVNDDTGATILGRSVATLHGFANQYRIITAGSKAFKAAVQAHRQERRDQRVLHGVRV